MCAFTFFPEYKPKINLENDKILAETSTNLLFFNLKIKIIDKLELIKIISKLIAIEIRQGKVT